jgi:glycosyltransferase involved in cell wall biosynthesis
MKILVLTKRYTSAKDISREEVGRPYCLFAALSGVGHSVSFLLGDYTERAFFDVERGPIQFKIRPLSKARILSFRRTIEEELTSGGYDLLIAEGDPLFALLARGPCRRTGVPLVYDLMDNYETYDIYQLPLFGRCDRGLVRDADLVVCVTEALREKIVPWRREDVYVVGNGVNTEQFQPMDKRECRMSLSLPESAILIGYFGYLVDYKGIDLLLQAHEILKGGGFPSTLLLAGDRNRAVRLPGEDVLYQGLVSQSEIPRYINACDAVVVPSPSNAYTDYCFPLKVLEGIACGVPVVATALRPVRELLGNDYPLLVTPGDPRELAEKIREACGEGVPRLREVALEHTWKQMAEALGHVLARFEKGGART